MVSLLIVRAVRIIASLVLFIAGIQKMRHPSRFRGWLVQGGVFGPASASAIVTIVLAAEVLLPIWMVLSLDTATAGLAAAFMMLIFTAYVLLLRALGRDVPCGCFGGAGSISDPFLSRNIGLSAMTSGVAAGRFAPYISSAGLALFLCWMFGGVFFAVRGASRARRMEDPHSATQVARTR